jgi:hypothetical protein
MKVSKAINDLSEKELKKMRFISDGTWFDEGTEAKLLCKTSEFMDGIWGGLFKGIRNGFIDEEMCASDEFKINGD